MTTTTHIRDARLRPSQLAGVLLSFELQQLPEDHEEIRRLLVVMGITGQRRACRACPLAAYLAIVLGHPIQLSGDCAHLCHPFRGFAWLPERARLFILHFDCGDYPELIEEAA